MQRENTNCHSGHASKQAVYGGASGHSRQATSHLDKTIRSLRSHQPQSSQRLIDERMVENAAAPVLKSDGYGLQQPLSIHHHSVSSTSARPGGQSSNVNNSYLRYVHSDRIDNWSYLHSGSRKHRSLITSACSGAADRTSPI